MDRMIAGAFTRDDFERQLAAAGFESIRSRRPTGSTTTPPRRSSGRPGRAERRRRFGSVRPQSGSSGTETPASRSISEARVIASAPNRSRRSSIAVSRRSTARPASSGSSIWTASSPAEVRQRDREQGHARSSVVGLIASSRSRTAARMVSVEDGAGEGVGAACPAQVVEARPTVIVPHTWSPCAAGGWSGRPARPPALSSLPLP